LCAEINRDLFIYRCGRRCYKEVKPYALVVGNPARQTGWMTEYGHKLNFNTAGFASCPESGERYKLEDGKFLKYFSIFVTLKILSHDKFSKNFGIIGVEVI